MSDSTCKIIDDLNKEIVLISGHQIFKCHLVPELVKHKEISLGSRVGKGLFAFISWTCRFNKQTFCPLQCNISEADLHIPSTRFRLLQ